MSYYFDVCVVGARWEERKFLHYQPCPKCGWSVPHALGTTRLDPKEKDAQAFCHGEAAYKAWHHNKRQTDTQADEEQNVRILSSSKKYQ